MNRHPASCQLAGEVPGELGGPLARRVPGNPEQVHPPRLVFDDERDVQAAKRERAIDVEEVGGQERGGVGAQEDAPQDPSRPDGGGMRWARRIFRTVEAATRCPSRRSSPWILTTPHRVFSRARRRISATSSSGIGGRPGGLGWRHFAATRRRCQRSSVPGVTIRRARSPFGMILVERGEYGPVGPGHARSGVRPA